MKTNRWQIKHWQLALTILALAILACTKSGSPTQIPTQGDPLAAPTKTIKPSPMPSDYQSFTITAEKLYIRDSKGAVISRTHFEKGDTVVCAPRNDGWCQMRNRNQVWQGCLSNPMEWLCKSASRDK